MGVRVRGRLWKGWACALGLLVVGTAGCVAEASDRVQPPDPYRPLLHLTPARHWMNDPNGPTWVDGRFHLFFQFNPVGPVWGNIGWGHATSIDLLRWQEEPLALPRTDSTMIFSGAVVHDSLGTSGLCRGPRCLVAIYTAAHRSTKVQSQSLAFSADGGQRWTPYAGNPVLSRGLTEFRDPWVFWDATSRSWIMAVVRAAEHVVDIYRSADLRRWRQASTFGPAGATGGVWECPVLVPLAVEGQRGVTRWLLKVDLNPGHPGGGSGAQYFVGAFDGTRFRPDSVASTPRWVDHGPDFYCAQPWPAPVGADSGRRTWIGWMSNWRYADRTPTGSWRGAMSLPRDVQLREVAGVSQLQQQPIAEVTRYRGRGQSQTFNRQSIADATVLAGVDGDALDVELVLVAGTAEEVGVLLRHAPESAVDGGEHVLVAYDARRRVVVLDRRRSGNRDEPESVRALFQTRHEAPRLRPLGAGGDTLRVRIVMDRSSVEVFADDGEVVLTGLVFAAPQSRAVALFTKGGQAQHLTVRTWPLRATPLR